MELAIGDAKVDGPELAVMGPADFDSQGGNGVLAFWNQGPEGILDDRADVRRVESVR